MKEEIKEYAASLGFSFCGFTRPEPLDEIREFYLEFIEKQRYATLTYLKRYALQRLDPLLLLPGATTVVALLYNHYSPETSLEEVPLQIANYARGRDGHLVVKPRLRLLANKVSEVFPGSHSRFFFDSGPLLEKQWAQRCGAGWIGKNSLLINPRLGSYVNIGILLTTAEIPADAPETDHCGSCNRCVRACPTGALQEPYRLRIDRCLAYHTIENRGDVPPDIREKTSGWIYGCDICQEVCPYNRSPQPSADPECHPSALLASMRRDDWINLSERSFHELFGETPVARLGYEGLMRNIRFNDHSSSPQR